MTTNDDVARTLRELADKISRREPIEVSGDSFIVPPDVRIKLKYKEKEARTKFKISLVWPQENGGGSKSNTVTAGDLMEQYRLPDSPPDNFKQLKKDMQHALYYFRRLGGFGQCPSADDIDRYVRLQEAFASAAKSSWREGVEEAAMVTQEMANAANAGDVSGVTGAIERLLQIKKIYHDRYK